MFCRNCGQSLEENAKFCTACGTKAEEAVEEAVSSAQAENTETVDAASEALAETEKKTEEAVAVTAEAVEEKAEEAVEAVEEAVEEKTEAVEAKMEANLEEKAETVEAKAEEKTESTYTPPAVEKTETVVAAEKAEEKPSKALKPLTTLSCIGWMLLYSFPIIGLCFSIAMSFGATENINRRSMARCFLIFKIIALVLFIAALVCTLIFANEILDLLNGILGENYSTWEQLINAYEFID